MRHSPKSCHETDRGLPVADLGYSAGERAVLRVIRHYCVSFAAPAQQGWIGGIAAALEAFGDERGPHVAVAALGVMQTLRQARQSGFRFNTPECPSCALHVTSHERLLMSALRAISRDRPEAARAHAVLLCEGNAAERVTEALALLAAQAFAPCANAPGKIRPEPVAGDAR